MRYASDLLYRLLDATGTGEGSPASQDLEIPPGISPIVSVPGPFISAIAIVTLTVQRESFMIEFNLTRAASQAQINSRVAVLGRGLWRVNVRLQHHADFTSAPGANGGQFGLEDPDGNFRALARLPNIANVSQAVVIDFDMLLDRDSWQFDMLQGATGVGQTLHTSVDGVILRLT